MKMEEIARQDEKDDSYQSSESNHQASDRSSSKPWLNVRGNGGGRKFS